MLKCQFCRCDNCDTSLQQFLTEFIWFVLECSEMVFVWEEKNLTNLLKVVEKPDFLVKLRESFGPEYEFTIEILDKHKELYNAGKRN